MLACLVAPSALVSHCPSPAELEDVALASTSYNDLIAALRACAALVEQQQRLMSSAALLLGSPAGMEGGGAAPPVPPRRTVSSTSLPPHGAVPPPVPPRRRRATAAAPQADLPEGSPAPPVPPRRRRASSLPPAGSPAPPVPPRRHRSPTADAAAAAAAAAVTAGDAVTADAASAKPMRDRLATWHESREEQAAAQRAQQAVVARNLRAGKPQHVVRAATHLAEPQVRPASQPVLLPRTVTQPKLAYTNIFRNSIQNKVAGERVHFSKF